MFVSGLVVIPIDNDFIDVLCCKLSQHGYSALCALNRGSFQLYTSTIPGTNEKPKKIGSCSENISDALFDLDAWRSKVLQLGFQNITLIGHCIGCNKIVHYLARTQNLNCIKRLVFLSPLNMKNWLTTKPYFQDIVKAKGIAQNKQTDLIKCGFIYKTPASIDDMLNNPVYMNLPNIYESKFTVYSDYTSIQMPMTIIFGEEEHVPQKIQQNFVKYSSLPNLINCFTIPKANHCYEGQEQLLAKTIVRQLKSSIKQR